MHLLPRIRLGLVAFGCLVFLVSAYAADSVSLSLIADRAAPPPVRHGLKKLEAALQAKGVPYEEIQDAAKAHGSTLIVAGIASQPGLANELAQTLGAHPATVPEALLVRRTSWERKPVVLVVGSDAVGLMYALLDIADRVEWAADAAQPLSEVKETSEQPSVRERGVNIYAMQKAAFETRFHDEAYWARYFDTLAQDRLNSFGLMLGYENGGFLQPPYPYFMEVENFPEVSVTGLSKAQQQQNLDDLNRLVQMAHDRGVKVTIGIWHHIYRPGEHVPPAKRAAVIEAAKHPGPGRVWGLTDVNLLPYTEAAAAKFVRQVPGIDRLMFIMHGESGLRPVQMHDFWATVFRSIHLAAPKLLIEAHEKDVPDDIIEDALRTGVNIRMHTKYWSEQAGLPYPPTHVQGLNQFDRRHGYADMLSYPHKYNLHWILWTSGTMRILLWGDPDYVRRFAGTTQIAGTSGFDFTEPLATWMAGHPQDMKPVDPLQPAYRYYDYPFERYWHFFQVFGRVSYDPATPTEVWDREFVRRFGPEAGPLLEQGLHRASQILPRIVTYCLPANLFSTTRGWAERQRWDDLPDYAASEPSDTQQFQSFAETARDLVEGTESAKIDPRETSRWFDRTADEVLRLVQGAEAKAGADRSKEFTSTATDLRILAGLARYHARRIPAGLDLALFKRTQDVTALDAAIIAEQRAIKAWEEVVAAAGDVYGDDLALGLPEYDLGGHWRDDLVKLNNGLAALQRQRDAFRPEPRRLVGTYDVPGNGVLLAGMPNGSYELGVSIGESVGPMWIEANGSDDSNTFRVDYGQTERKILATTVADGKMSVVFRATSNGTWKAGPVSVTRIDPLIAHIPVRRLAPNENFVVRATVSGIDAINQVRVVYGDERGYRTQALQGIGPDRYEANLGPTRAGVGLSYFLEAEDKAGRWSRWPATGRVAVTISGDREPPQLQHVPVTNAEPGQPLRIVATVTDPSGVKWVRVRYRGMSQYQDFSTQEMLPNGRPGEYEVEIPGDRIDSRFDFMYLFEVMDQAGNGKIYPDLEKETPYVIVHLQRSA